MKSSGWNRLLVKRVHVSILWAHRCIHQGKRVAWRLGFLAPERTLIDRPSCPQLIARSKSTCLRYSALALARSLARLIKEMKERKPACCVLALAWPKSKRNPITCRFLSPFPHIPKCALARSHTYSRIVARVFAWRLKTVVVNPQLA